MYPIVQRSVVRALGPVKPLIHPFSLESGPQQRLALRVPGKAEAPLFFPSA